MIKPVIAAGSLLLLAWAWPRPSSQSGFAGMALINPTVSPGSFQNVGIVGLGEFKIVNSDNKQDLDSLFVKHGAVTGVPWQLLKAVAMRESSLNPDAINEEYDGPGGVASRGIMQVLCPQKLNVPGWKGREPEGGCNVLFDPDKGIHFGAHILKWNLETFGFPRGVSVYNNYSMRKAPLHGPFSNQGYVDAILRYFIQYGGDIEATNRKYNRGKS